MNVSSIPAKVRTKPDEGHMVEIWLQRNNTKELIW